MNSKTRSLFFICLGLLFGMSVMYIYRNFIEDKKTVHSKTFVEYSSAEPLAGNNSYSQQQSIDQLTEQNTVIRFVKQNHKLPEYYITKNEARKLGWKPSERNLCEVLPGKAIGGDRFGNREKALPERQIYFEADVNYNCGNRNADRIIFTENGDVYLTKNHYKSFEKQ
ncbi:ribonuclease N [Chryseobacterium shandongense]|uniref:Ribonuclease n=1 Tax=Chryseobacterium shandongense TaxID=1493872 RepID=A0AAD0YD92_9FLAO|nr:MULTISPECIES: ribonuclease domain-containing protein [Chryseobacterium]AZA86624.1 ribonuclease N [Chryseobacterium shandongense]AZA95037.1 ribonuclease N [Chryseobacterium shandongense]